MTISTARRRASATPARSAFENAVQRLPNPADYFSGHRVGLGALPNDVLMFRRTHRSHLGSVPHNHHRHVLITPLVTPGCVVVDENAHRIAPGDALLVFPYQFHHFTAIEAPRVLWLFTTFDMDYTTPLAALRDQPRRFTAEARAELERATRAFALVPQRGEPCVREARLRIALVLSALADGTPSKNKANTTTDATDEASLLKAVARFVFGRLGEPLSVTDVARHVGISPSHLRSQFRKQYGMGVYGYIRHVKMLQAMRLLRTRTQRVSEIAERLGYSSVFVFSRAFKKEAGVAPRLYQKRHA